MSESGSLAGKIAFVSGGGRGIGRAIALALARHGADVGVCSRTKSEIDSVAAECRAWGTRAWSIQLDVSDAVQCRDAVATLQTEAGRIDILVNNAGVATSQKFLDLSDDSWKRAFAVNVDSAMYLTRATLPDMLRRRQGRVITISSIAGKAGAAYVAQYCASKHAVIGLMRSLAVEYRSSGVTFNSVCPAYVDTPMTDAALDFIVLKTGRSREQALQVLVTPQGRLVRPEEVAAVCLLLASEEGAGITGQAINVDGGTLQW